MGVGGTSATFSCARPGLLARRSGPGGVGRAEARVEGPRPVAGTGPNALLPHQGRLPADLRRRADHGRVPEGTWYGGIRPTASRCSCSKHLIEGKPVEEWSSPQPLPHPEASASRYDAGRVVNGGQRLIEIQQHVPTTSTPPARPRPRRPGPAERLRRHRGGLRRVLAVLLAACSNSAPAAVLPPRSAPASAPAGSRTQPARGRAAGAHQRRARPARLRRNGIVEHHQRLQGRVGADRRMLQ